MTQVYDIPLRAEGEDECRECGETLSDHTCVMVADGMTINGRAELSNYYFCPGQWEDIDQFVYRED